MPVDARALADRLERLDARAYRVVCLPDFFLDHFVELPEWEAAVDAMRRIHAQGGGNLQRVPQRFASGGNAANTALALARLGVRAALVTRTSRFGAETLRSTLGEAGVDLSRVRPDGDLAVTTALEFGAAKRNVMLSNAGSLLDYSFKDLDEEDLRAVEESDAVLVANWSQCVRGGTDLVTGVCRVAEKSGTIAYVDTGDPSGRAEEVPAFVEGVLATAPLGVLAVNENELSHYSGIRAVDEGGLLAAGARLAPRLKGRLDLHTSAFAASWTQGADPARAPAFRVRPLRATGAGDAWNAGNILGYLADLDAEERLLVANAVAGAYISSEGGRHPGLRDLASFLRTRDGLTA